MKKFRWEPLFSCEPVGASTGPTSAPISAMTSRATPAMPFPSYGADAAKMLIDRGIAVLGVDTTSIDNGPSKDFLVHGMAGAANIVGLENATNLEKLPATGAWVIVLPIKIANGSGAPARAIALSTVSALVVDLACRAPGRRDREARCGGHRGLSPVRGSEQWCPVQGTRCTLIATAAPAAARRARSPSSGRQRARTSGRLSGQRLDEAQPSSERRRWARNAGRCR